MPDRWTEEMLDHAPPARPEFREELRREVIEAWDEADAPRAGSGHGRPRWIAAAVAAAVAAMVGAGIAVLVVDNDQPGPGSAADTTKFTQSTASRRTSRADVVGTWVVTERSQLVDPGGPRALLPMAAPLPTYRFGDDGVVSGFDGCNGVVANWSFEDGRFDRGGEGPSGTAASSAMLCSTADGEPIPTIGPFPVGLEESNGLLVMAFEQDGEVAHAYRLRDLIAPESIVGSWVLPVDGSDVTIEFGDDRSVTVGESGASPCAQGSYTLEGGAVTLDVSTTATCPSDVVSSGTFQVVLFSDLYATETLLLVPAEGGAIRLYQSGITVSSSDESPPGTTSPDENCLREPIIELVSTSDRVTMDLVYYQEMLGSCGLNVDGEAFFDDAFRPARAVVAVDGELKVVTSSIGFVSVDVRLLKPGMRLAAVPRSKDVLAATRDGTYSISLPRPGCFVATVDWRAEGRDGRFTGLAETGAGECDVD